MPQATNFRFAQRTIGKGQGLAGFGGYLQSPQGAVVGLSRPAQHRGATAGAQALFGAPQGIAVLGLDDDQMVQIHSAASQAWGRTMGRATSTTRSPALVSLASVGHSRRSSPIPGLRKGFR